MADRKNESLLADDFCRSVYEMMVGFGQVEGEDWGAHNSQPVSEPEESIRKLRHELILEEFMEFQDASSQGDLVEVADALGDMMVVIAGTAIAYNIDLPSVLSEIQRSNLAKIEPETGRVIRREDGKILKPEGWTSPEVARVM